MILPAISSVAWLPSQVFQGQAAWEKAVEQSLGVGCDFMLTGVDHILLGEDDIAAHMVVVPVAQLRQLTVSCSDDTHRLTRDYGNAPQGEGAPDAVFCVSGKVTVASVLPHCAGHFGLFDVPCYLELSGSAEAGSLGADRVLAELSDGAAGSIVLTLRAAAFSVCVALTLPGARGGEVALPPLLADGSPPRVSVASVLESVRCRVGPPRAGAAVAPEPEGVLLLWEEGAPRSAPHLVRGVDEGRIFQVMRGAAVCTLLVVLELELRAGIAETRSSVAFTVLREEDLRLKLLPLLEERGLCAADVCVLVQYIICNVVQV